MAKKKKNRSVLQFFTSLLLTVLILGGGSFLVATDKIPVEAGTLQSKSNISRLLFLETDNNLTYEIVFDFDLKKLTVKRLQFDNSIYHSVGLSGTVAKATAEHGNFTSSMAVSETQAAAIIDYVGGYPCNVGEHISSLCKGISLGYQSVSGISVIEIFKSEQSNVALCLDIIETTTLSWCEILGEPRHFFKLLNISNSDLSYTDYLPLADKFSTISNKT